MDGGTITLQSWDDPLTTAGYPVQSRYTELFWLPLLGPSSLLLLRRTDQLLSVEAKPVTMGVAELAQSLGLGPTGRHGSLLVRTIKRCCDFRVARQVGDTTLEVKRKLAPLTDRQILHLPHALRQLHFGTFEIERYRLLAESSTRLAQMTATLRDLGADPSEIADQLQRMGYERPVSHSMKVRTPNPVAP